MVDFLESNVYMDIIIIILLFYLFMVCIIVCSKATYGILDHSTSTSREKYEINLLGFPLKRVLKEK